MTYERLRSRLCPAPLCCTLCSAVIGIAQCPINVSNMLAYNNNIDLSDMQVRAIRNIGERKQFVQQSRYSVKR